MVKYRIEYLLTLPVFVALFVAYLHLALKRDSGVPQGAVREINLTAKDLAAKFGPIDEAGDSGDLAGTEKVYREMVAMFETLEKHVDPEAAHGDHDH